ncbi:MAG TPA: hypothetical protein VF546_13440 [Pyrinomonadaceae bacterium]
MFAPSVLDATQAALSSYHTIAGRLLRIEAQGDWAAQWVASFLNGFYLDSTAAPADGGAAITLRVGRKAPTAVPSGPQTFAINHGVCHTDGARYFLAVDDSLVHVAAPEARLVEVWFGTSAHARHPVALVNTFSYGLQAALRRAGVYDLHAAAARDPATGAGALFVGASGSGKTTLTLRLAACGWHYLSDDMVVLRETPGAVEAEGLRRLFAVAEKSIAAAGLRQIGAALGPPVASDPSKHRLEPEAVFPGARAARATPRALLFPRVTDADRSALAPLTGREAMQRLVRACPWATYDQVVAPDYLRVLARLARQCRAYELRAGRDLLTEPERAADLLAPCLSE